ncbi:LysR substrate-binding domain-containing protein [Variovorax sp. J22G73]|jgi:DNA-binding transcriptional LysR family regulator|uniref:LysR substrate-binding domain-containing protein n=1 Tax=unclassified Variovorax TaxID=663243 RepID=UPI000E326EB1|nr:MULTISPECIES: LysR substrate-binding domain-containing protein [unclassified Variovorax]MDM0003605.1 LysR substrate-binding domain-containing protein [Variovorax sp. J22R203]MDM0096729.1 LysR substrate-binding domain-containing protein [Variovorax sp. J22G73]
MPLSLLRMPSLDLVRGFVAVGRRMSISLAAQDLCLTQSAVSKQVHALEAQLGVQLLVRGHRAISFTPEGERLFRSADGAVQQLQEVMGGIRQSGEQRPVTVSASIGMTGLWLLPRLRHVQALHPGVDVRVSSNNRVADLRNEGIDLAIRYTTPALAPAGAVRLFGETVAPVAHPSMGSKGALSWGSAEALSPLCLLDFEDAQHPWLQWRDWLAAVGWADARPQAVLHFNQYDQLIQAALAGQGVALGRLELIQPLLDERRLVRVDAPTPAPATDHAYWLIQAEPSPREDVRHVAAWLKSEARSEVEDKPKGESSAP